MAFLRNISPALLLLAVSCTGIKHPEVDFLSAPQAVGGDATMFSWSFPEEDDFIQDRCRIVVKDVWDSGEVTSRVPRMYLPDDVTMESFRRYRWKVEVWDADGHCRVGRGRFRTAVYPAGNWTARWIGIGKNAEPVFSRVFRVGKGVRKGLLCVSSSGGCTAAIDGKTVGLPFGLLTSHYGDLAGAYRVYDVTDLLTKGEQELSFRLAGASPSLIAELHLFYKDGSHDIVCTDETWDGAVQPSRVYRVLLPDETPLPEVTRMVPQQEKRGDTLYVFHFDGTVSGHCILDGKGREGDELTVRWMGEKGKKLGEETVTLEKKGRFSWIDIAPDRTFRDVEVRVPKGVRVSLQADIPEPVPQGWMHFRGKVEGFILDPAPTKAPFADVDTLYSRYGDRRLLEQAYPALERYLGSIRKKESLPNYALMEKFAGILGADGSAYTETIRIMTGK